MFYRLSNTASRSAIEAEFGMSFRHPGIYEPQILINGLDEASVPLVLQESPAEVRFGIWGLLPENFRAEWSVFQNSYNTLNVNPEALLENRWFGGGLRNRRCLFIVNGFFAMHLYQGDLYPYYVYAREKRPFAIAGIYSVLDDGFVTASLLTCRPNPLMRRIQNLGDVMPMVLPREHRDLWLEDLGTERLTTLLRQTRPPHLAAHPIAKELFNLDILYDGMLEPVAYQNLPIPQP